jgi:hypothetical protein
LGGNPAIFLRPVAFRPYLTIGLAFSLSDCYIVLLIQLIHNRFYFIHNHSLKTPKRITWNVVSSFLHLYIASVMPHHHNFYDELFRMPCKTVKDVGKIKFPHAICSQFSKNADLKKPGILKKFPTTFRQDYMKN